MALELDHRSIFQLDQRAVTVQPRDGRREERRTRSNLHARRARILDMRACVDGVEHEQRVER
jgi:hypothetical protein